MLQVTICAFLSPGGMEIITVAQIGSGFCLTIGFPVSCVNIGEHDGIQGAVAMTETFSERSVAVSMGVHMFDSHINQLLGVAETEETILESFQL